MIEPTYSIRFIVRLPAPLMEALEKYAGKNKQTISYVVRSAICTQIGAPERLARMYKHEEGYNKAQAQADKRKAERALIRTLKETSPELIAEAMRIATTRSNNGS